MKIYHRKIKMKCFLIIAAVLLLAQDLNAQLSDTDIWLFQLEVKKNGSIKKGGNITQRKGYDNQPSFSANSKNIYYASIQDGKQSDVYAYSINSKKTRRLTFTEESEYSPSELILNKGITVVSVLKDSSQVIQLLSDKTFTVSNASVAAIDSVGYYTFLNSDTLLYYVLTNPHSLRVIKTNGEHEHTIANHPARCFKAISRTEFVFGVKDSLKTVFYIFDFKLKMANILAEHKGVHEDLVWHNTKGLLISDGLKILKFSKERETWETLYDLSTYGLKKITRFCFSPNGKYLVVVDNTE